MLPPPPNETMSEAEVTSILNRTEGLRKDGPRFSAKAFDPGLQEVRLEGFFAHPSSEIHLLRTCAAVGAAPVGATNCLNFGNPEKPEVMWQFSEVIAGMSEALSAFGVPITGGNVSFYNETDGAGILPTPVVGSSGSWRTRQGSSGSTTGAGPRRAISWARCRTEARRAGKRRSA